LPVNKSNYDFHFLFLLVTMAQMETIHTDKAPKAVGPYSQAVQACDYVFCSGQIGLDPESGALVEGLEKQVKQALANLNAVLVEAGSDFEHVAKTTVFITNMDDFAKVNEIYGSYFTNHKPARSTVGVTALPKGALVEIEAIAYLSKEKGNCDCGECGC
jgi:2-iminobutanoate/2-iminopropanoate deaminase